MKNLASKECVPCREGVGNLGNTEITNLHKELPTWSVIDNHHLSKTFEFPDFVSALRFVNKTGEIAETQGHHPDIFLTWGKVKIDIWTHKTNGLTESDFILAAKIEELRSKK